MGQDGQAGGSLEGAAQVGPEVRAAVVDEVQWCHLAVLSTRGPGVLTVGVAGLVLMAWR